MAHQWFGDLVTTAWWNDIWLNEGFATWMETKIVNEWKPEWHANIDAVDDRIEAMGLDSLVSARKIRQPILSQSDIANAFDNITYMKGAAVLRMFENYIGPDVFRRGVHAYLETHADKNATTEDFLASIGAAAGRNVAPAFDTFLDKPGVPEISAALRCGQDRPSLRLTQKRYLPIGSPGRSQRVRGRGVMGYSCLRPLRVILRERRERRRRIGMRAPDQAHRRSAAGEGARLSRMAGAQCRGERVLSRNPSVE